MKDTEAPGPDFSIGIAVKGVPDGVPVLGHVGGEPVIVVRRGDKLRAVGATCTHWHAPLAEGLVVGDTIRCPWHHARFSLDTGRVRAAPALDGLVAYDVECDDDTLRVCAARPAPGPREATQVGQAAVVIVGTGAAGAACAEALRREGHQGPVTLVGEEVPVDRPNLSKAYLAGKAEAAWMPLRSAEDYTRLGIAREPGRVRAIDLAGRTLELDDGRRLTYGELVLATGSEAVALPVPGADRDHVFRLRTLADADAILGRIRGTRQVVVVGASFVGLEVAASLRSRGMAVTVVAPEDSLLERVYGRELGAYLLGLYESHGVEFCLGARPSEITATSVRLEDGRSIDADLVVTGVGVRPTTSLAEAAGLAVDRGILVDEFLRASAPHVYAAGDVARYPVEGGTARIEHWTVAMRQGEAIARTLVGRPEPFTDVPFFWSEHFDVSIAFVGHAPRWDSAEVLGDLEARDATVAYRVDGRICAVATIGRDRVSLAAEAAMARRDQAALELIVKQGE